MRLWVMRYFSIITKTLHDDVTSTMMMEEEWPANDVESKSNSVSKELDHVGPSSQIHVLRKTWTRCIHCSDWRVPLQGDLTCPSVIQALVSNVAAFTFYMKRIRSTCSIYCSNTISQFLHVDFDSYTCSEVKSWDNHSASLRTAKQVTRLKKVQSRFKWH